MVVFMFVLVPMLYFRDFGGGMAYVAEVGSAAWQSRGNLFKVLGSRAFLQEALAGARGGAPRHSSSGRSRPPPTPPANTIKDEKGAGAPFSIPRRKPGRKVWNSDADESR